MCRQDVGCEFYKLEKFKFQLILTNISTLLLYDSKNITAIAADNTLLNRQKASFHTNNLRGNKTECKNVLLLPQQE